MGAPFTGHYMQTAKVIVEDNFSDYCAELRGVKEGSLLEELDDLSTESWFKGLLESSVAYVMLTRCGISPFGMSVPCSTLLSSCALCSAIIIPACGRSGKCAILLLFLPVQIQYRAGDLPQGHLGNIAPVY